MFAPASRVKELEEHVQQLEAQITRQHLQYLQRIESLEKRLGKMDEEATITVENPSERWNSGYNKRDQTIRQNQGHSEADPDIVRAHLRIPECHP